MIFFRHSIHFDYESVRSRFARREQRQFFSECAASPRPQPCLHSSACAATAECPRRRKLELGSYCL